MPPNPPAPDPRRPTNNLLRQPAATSSCSCPSVLSSPRAQLCTMRFASHTAADEAHLTHRRHPDAATMRGGAHEKRKRAPDPRTLGGGPSGAWCVGRGVGAAIADDEAVEGFGVVEEGLAGA